MLRTLRNRLRYPWPVYRKVGGVRAVKHHADGTVEDLGVIAPAYAKRWRASSPR